MGRLSPEFELLQRRTKRFSKIGARRAATMLGLLLEFCHRLRIMPTRAGQIPIVLISIFFNPFPHISISLMVPKSTISHVRPSPVAGATRVDLVISWFRMLSTTFELDAPN